MVNTCLRTHKQAQDSWADQGSISCPEQTGSPNRRPLRLPCCDFGLSSHAIWVVGLRLKQKIQLRFIYISHALNENNF